MTLENLRACFASALRDEKKGKKHKEEADTCPECDKKLVKINECWRCKNCDQYCRKCGALADEMDESCPECGAEIKGEKE